MKKQRKRSKYNPKYKNKDKYNKKSNFLIDVWYDTKKYFEINRIWIPPSIKYNINDLNEINIANNYQNTIVEIVNTDSFNLGINYVDEGLRPLILNMASDFRPGGGVDKGKIAQEEELFRRSNAHLTHPKSWYPLDTNEIIYSPEITIIKDTTNRKYEYLKNKEIVSMIACAAIRNPRLVEGKYNKNDYDLIYSKIEAIFKIAIEQNHDSIVLGAFGCGAFHNPPEEVASIFNIIINKYRTNFKKIGFAVLVVKKPDYENLNAFKKIIIQ